MVVSAEPPAELDEGRRGIEELGSEVADIGRWEPRPDGLGWFITVTLVPKELDPYGRIRERTPWCVLVPKGYPVGGTITIWPAKDGGITDTFAHQLPNDLGGTATPWRDGQICVVTSVSGHRRMIASQEPQTAYHRVAWNLSLALDWLRRASRNQLVPNGDPFELPFFGQRSTSRIQIAYFEGPETYAEWSSVAEHEGLVDLALAAGQRSWPTFVATEWLDLGRKRLVVPNWGRKIKDLKPAETAVWLRFDELLVNPPWRAPQNWKDLRDFASERAPDLEDRLREGLSRIRDGRPHCVLVGFPVPRLMGDPPSVMSWVAFRTPNLESLRPKQTKDRGHRLANAAWQADRTTGALSDDKPIKWLGTENWHPDSLAARGRFDALTCMNVFLIGAGALGSSLAETLVRAGVRDITICDGDVLVAGNLVRHRLTLDEVGTPKAFMLAYRLNSLSPSVRATAISKDFSSLDDEIMKAARLADVVVDATAADLVPQRLSRDIWHEERVFVSVSLSYGAERLYFYIARGDRFPVDDFKAQLEPWLALDARPVEDFPLPTGCFDPVFPARADDIELFAAIAARQIDTRISGPIDDLALVVYARKPDGTVELADLPVAPTAAA